MRQKSLLVTYVLWLFLGFYGAHRFYLGKHGSGLLYLLTCGLFGVGWLVDFFLIPSMVKSESTVQDIGVPGGPRMSTKSQSRISGIGLFNTLLVLTGATIIAKKLQDLRK